MNNKENLTNIFSSFIAELKILTYLCEVIEIYVEKIDFAIAPERKISNIFLAKGITSFLQASQFVGALKYGRDANKKDLMTIFTDNCATCSTKHALLKRLAEENHIEGLQSMLGIFRMNVDNTPKIGHILRQYGLAYLPEAHNYLRFGRQLLDFTMKFHELLNFEPTLLEEMAISVEQITDYKIAYHIQYLSTWLVKNPTIQLTLEELWQVREQCIAVLAS